MKAILSACSIALVTGLAPLSDAQAVMPLQTTTVELEGNVITVPSPLRVDSREVKAIVTPLVFNDEHFEAIDRAKRIHMHSFPLDRNTMLDLELTSFEVFGPNSVRVRGTANGDVPAKVAPMALLRGSVVGIPESTVFLAVSPVMSNGIIRMNGTTYIVSNGDFKENVGIAIYNLTDLPEGEIDWFEFVCDVEEDPTAPVAEFGDTPVEQPCRRVEVAIETDNEFAQIFSNDPELAEPQANAYIETLVGAVSQIYTESWNMRYNIAYSRVWPDPSDPDDWAGQSTSAALSELRDVWTPVSAPYIGDWNGAHFISGKFLGGGLAAVSAICNQSRAHAVSTNINGFFPNPLVNNDSQNWDVIVTAHEWGHNWGGPHTHGLIPPVDGCGFGDCSLAEFGTILSYCHQCPGGYTNIELVFAERMLVEAILPYVSIQLPTLCDLTIANQADCDAGAADCPADVNGNGTVERADFTAWIVAYNTNDLAADINRNGTLEPADFSAWLAAYQATYLTGCPE